MKLNRRGFFGAAAGAAVAGPSVVEQGMQAMKLADAGKASHMISTYPEHWNPTPDKSHAIEDREWVQKDFDSYVSNLLRLREKAPTCSRMTIQHEEVNGWRSVSSVNKMRILHERSDAQYIKTEIESIEGCMRSMMDRHPFLKLAAGVLGVKK